MLAILGLSFVVPVVVIEDASLAVPLAQALLKGGIRVLEVTLRTPAALKAIEEIVQKVPQVIVGAGTIIHPRQFVAAKTAGAAFTVSPGLAATLVTAARAVQIPYLPGVATASEALE